MTFQDPVIIGKAEDIQLQKLNYDRKKPNCRLATPEDKTETFQRCARCVGRCYYFSSVGLGSQNEHSRRGSLPRIPADLVFPLGFCRAYNTGVRCRRALR